MKKQFRDGKRDFKPPRLPPFRDAVACRSLGMDLWPPRLPPATTISDGLVVEPPDGFAKLLREAVKSGKRARPMKKGEKKSR